MIMDNFDPNIAHIRDGDQVFQVLVFNDEGQAVDWDESATRSAYEAWLLEKNQ